MIQDSVKQIYLDYCEENDIPTCKEILQVINKQETKLSLNKQNNQSLQSLNLDKSQMFGISLVIQQNLQNLKEIEICNHQFTNDQILVISSAAKENCFLEKLILQNDMIDDTMVESISYILNINQSIRYLDLAYNKIKNEGAQILAETLVQNKNLRVLKVQRNFIEEDYFGNMLKDNDMLQLLDVSYNKYNLESIETLFKGLYQNQNLKNLNLIGMNIGEIHLHLLCEILEKNNSLQSIELDFLLQQEDQDIIEKIQQSLMINHTLTDFNSTKMNISMQDPITEGIYALLRSNEWISRNYESFLKNKAPPCPEFLRDTVIKKLDQLQNQIGKSCDMNLMRESQNPFVLLQQSQENMIHHQFNSEIVNQSQKKSIVKFSQCFKSNDHHILEISSNQHPTLSSIDNNEKSQYQNQAFSHFKNQHNDISRIDVNSSSQKNSLYPVQRPENGWQKNNNINVNDGNQRKSDSDRITPRYRQQEDTSEMSKETLSDDQQSVQIQSKQQNKIKQMQEQDQQKLETDILQSDEEDLHLNQQNQQNQEELQQQFSQKSSNMQQQQQKIQSIRLNQQQLQLQDSQSIQNSIQMQQFTNNNNQNKNNNYIQDLSMQQQYDNTNSHSNNQSLEDEMENRLFDRLKQTISDQMNQQLEQLCNFMDQSQQNQRNLEDRYMQFESDSMNQIAQLQLRLQDLEQFQKQNEQLIYEKLYQMQNDMNQNTQKQQNCENGIESLNIKFQSFQENQKLSSKITEFNQEIQQVKDHLIQVKSSITTSQILQNQMQNQSFSQLQQNMVNQQLNYPQTPQQQKQSQQISQSMINPLTPSQIQQPQQQQQQQIQLQQQNLSQNSQQQNILEQNMNSTMNTTQLNQNMNTSEQQKQQQIITNPDLETFVAENFEAIYSKIQQIQKQTKQIKKKQNQFDMTQSQSQTMLSNNKSNINTNVNTNSNSNNQSLSNINNENNGEMDSDNNNMSEELIYKKNIIEDKINNNNNINDIGQCQYTAGASATKNNQVFDQETFCHSSRKTHNQQLQISNKKNHQNSQQIDKSYNNAKKSQNQSYIQGQDLSQQNLINEENINDFDSNISKMPQQIQLQQQQQQYEEQENLDGEDQNVFFNQIDQKNNKSSSKIDRILKKKINSIVNQKLDQFQSQLFQTPNVSQFQNQQIGTSNIDSSKSLDKSKISNFGNNQNISGKQNMFQSDINHFKKQNNMDRSEQYLQCNHHNNISSNNENMNMIAQFDNTSQNQTQECHIHQQQNIHQIQDFASQYNNSSQFDTQQSNTYQQKSTDTISYRQQPKQNNMNLILNQEQDMPLQLKDLNQLYPQTVRMNECLQQSQYSQPSTTKGSEKIKKMQQVREQVNDKISKYKQSKQDLKESISKSNFTGIYSQHSTVHKNEQENNVFYKSSFSNKKNQRNMSKQQIKSPTFSSKSTKSCYTTPNKQQNKKQNQQITQAPSQELVQELRSRGIRVKQP